MKFTIRGDLLVYFFIDKSIACFLQRIMGATSSEFYGRAVLQGQAVHEL
jgi:hypothetical protein